MQATWQRAVDAIGALLLCAVLGVTLLQVAARYIFNWSVPWSEEMTRLLFVWMVMVAAASASHMRIDLFVAYLPKRLRRSLDLLLATGAASLLVLMGWQSFGLIALTHNDRYAALGLSVQFLYWAVPVGVALWLVRLALDAFGRHDTTTEP